MGVIIIINSLKSLMLLQKFSLNLKDKKQCIISRYILETIGQVNIFLPEVNQDRNFNVREEVI